MHFIFLANPGRSTIYIRSISRPAPPLHSFYIFEKSRLVPSVHQECSSACTTFAFIFYFWETLAGPTFTSGVLVGLHHLCIYFIFLTKPGQFQRYISSISWPAPPLHSFFIFEKPQPGLPLHQEYWSACTTFAFIFLFLRNPGRAHLYIRSIGRPALPLHSFYIFDKSRPVLVLHQEY